VTRGDGQLDRRVLRRTEETLISDVSLIASEFLAGFHAVCASMFDLARGYAEEGMTAYVGLQQHELALEDRGYTATRHQREVGAGYFDAVLEAVTGGESSTLALKGSTEEAQFEAAPAR